MFPTLVFDFLLDDVNELAAVLGMGGKDLPLSSFFFGEGFGGHGSVLGEVVDFFENSGLEFFVSLVLDESELTPEETNLFLVPL